MFYKLPKEIIIKIYSYDSTYRDIYNENMNYIKNYFDKNTLYWYDDDLWYCYFIKPSEDKYVFIKRYYTYYSTGSNYLIKPFSKAILDMKIYDRVHKL